MNVTQWVRTELEDLAFTCLENCGFCCTFTPEVSAPELNRLKLQFPSLKVVREDAHMRIAFQGGCGACTLLQRRACTAYDARPAHCRYFPFHVYFGERTEVYVNRSCRGVEVRPGTSLEDAFASSVVAVASPAAILEHQRQARKVARQFQANAHEAGMWGDVGAVAHDVLDAMKRKTWLPDEATYQTSLAPFAESDPVARPYYLDADLRWLTFVVTGNRFQTVAMDETGQFEKVGDPFVPTVPPDGGVGVTGTLAFLASRSLFADQVYARVDESDYTESVTDATRARLADMASDLLVRQSILRHLGVSDARLAEEALRFYDSAFLDYPTIGGFL